MRIIHTADWHLCDRLGRVDRTGDLRSRVEIVAGLCEDHAADVLLIAGDLFSEHASLDDMTAALEHVRTTFGTFFERGGTVIGVTGNHDREARVELLRQGMRLATPDASREFRPGRMYLLNRPFVGAHQTRSGERAQFVLVPYPTTIRYGREGDRPATKEEEHRTLNNRVVEWLNGDAQSKLDPKLPTVLVGHLHITGAGLSHSLYRLTERDDVVFETGVRPAWAQYVALGHIHKQQALAGFADVWYSGSLDRLDFGERDDDKGVVMVEIDETGLRGEPVPLPLPATPMVRVVIDDAADELPTLAERVPDPMSSLVHVTARFRPGGPTRDEITRAVRVTFPRLIELAWERPDPHTADRPTSVCTATDYRATVRDYLSRDVPADDPDRAALLELVETFLTPEAQP